MQLAQPKFLNDDKTRVRICCRLSYANVFEPRAFAGQDPNYSAALLVDKEDTATVEAIREAIKAAVEQGKASKWGGKLPAKLRSPLYDGGEEKPGDPVYDGVVYLNAKAKLDRKPQVVLRHRDPKTGKPVPADEEDVYSGCYANVSVSFYPYSFSGNNGIGVGLGNIQKWEDGEKLAGGATADSDFDFDELEELSDDWLM